MMISNDERIFNFALLSMNLMSLFNVLALQFISAPYGKHRRPGWGPTIPPSLAWLLMESPTLWLSLLLFPHGRHRSHPLALLLFSPYLLHYLHRTLIYPLRLQLTANPHHTPTANGYPLSIALIAFFYNLHNAYLQSRSVSHYADYPQNSHGVWIWVRILVGFGIFLWGMKVNVESDLALVKLKKEGGGYKIPRGGWFEVVCSPNYMGEAVEWLGWAVMTWSPAAVAFFLYTCSNLVPRARSHLKWYREKFGEEYPRSRKAIVPFVY